jgi:hypothetical protein
MQLRITSIAAAVVFLFVPAVFLGQQVDPSVVAVDPSANSRVQDPDRPASALLPGGSSAWTGQPIMSEMPFAGTSGSAQSFGSTSKANQFPSLSGISLWGTSSSAAWAGQSVVSDPSSATSGPAQRLGSMSTASQFSSLSGISAWGPSSSAALSPLNASGARAQTQRARQWKKPVRSRKPDMTMMASDEMQLVRLGSSGNEFSEEVKAVEELRPTDPNLKLRELKQAAARTARLRSSNPFKSKADSSTPLWAHDASSLRALGQQQHEVGMLLHSGYGAQSARRKRGHGTAAAAPGSR